MMLRFTKREGVLAMFPLPNVIAACLLVHKIGHVGPTKKMYQFVYSEYNVVYMLVIVASDKHA